MTSGRKQADSVVLLCCVVLCVVILRPSVNAEGESTLLHHRLPDLELNVNVSV